MRFLALAVLAGALVALLQVERRNVDLPWWAKNYGRMNRDWIDRQLR